MWYGGNNAVRPVVSGKPLTRGIIEQRDRLLDLIMNHSTKLIAALTGDEHNYSLLHIDKKLPIYPENWEGPRLEKYRPFWQINNGAAGAPYYGREKSPWADHVKTFSTQNALVLFHVDGTMIEVEVVNPDTLEEIDRYKIR